MKPQVPIIDIAPLISNDNPKFTICDAEEVEEVLKTLDADPI